MPEDDFDWSDPYEDTADADIAEPAPGQPVELPEVEVAAGEDGFDWSDPYEDGAAGAEEDPVAAAQKQVGGKGDFILGGIDGLLLNYGDEIGGVGEAIGSAISPRNPDAAYADDGNLDIFDDAKKTTAGKAGNIVGNIASGTGIGMATGGLGSVGTQMAIGGGTGALAGYGESHDPLQALMSGFTGATTAGLGKLASNAMTRGKAAAPTTRLTNADEAGAAFSLPDDAIELPPMTPEDAMSMSPNAPPGVSSATFEKAGAAKVRPDELGDWGKIANDMGSLMLKGNPSMLNPKYMVGKLMQAGGQGKLRPSDSAINKMVGGVSGAAQGATWGGDVSKASGQTVARPDVSTVNWAMQAVNASGDLGLPPEAQQKLDQALLSGDDNRISSVYMQYSMKYPAFQRRIQSELESINGGE